jgi:CBS domain-containing protein
MNARNLMSSNLIVVPPEMPVGAIAELLASRGISAVPVVDDSGSPVGIVTEGDLIHRLAEKPRGPLRWFLDLFGNTKPMIEQFEKAHGKTARDVMTRDLHSVSEEASAEEIAHLMEAHRIRRVPVVKDGKLVGIVSRADLLRAVLRTVKAAPPTPAAGDDRAILRAVIAAMRDQPWTDTFWVYPNVTDGVVTLYGFARSQTMREGLRVLVEEIPGVKSVVDSMEDMPLILRAMG